MDAPVIAEEYKPFFKTPYNHDTLHESYKTATFNAKPTLTQQHFREETDINEIVAKFIRTGQVKVVQLPPLFEDFGEEIFDYQSALNQVSAARASFEAMDPKVRDAFNNNPQQFVASIDEWLAETDPVKREQNLKVMRAMNLAVEPGEPADKTTLGDVLKAIKEQGTPPVEKDRKP